MSSLLGSAAATAPFFAGQIYDSNQRKFERCYPAARIALGASEYDYRSTARLRGAIREETCVPRGELHQSNDSTRSVPCVQFHGGSEILNDESSDPFSEKLF